MHNINSKKIGVIKNKIFIIYMHFFLFTIYTGFANAGYGDWSAKVIDVYDYAPTSPVGEINQGSIEPEEGVLKEVAASKGVSHLNAAGKKVSFKTKQNAELTWGDFYLNHPERERLLFGKKWGTQARPWVVRVKIRQSMKKSKWILETAYLQHGHRRTVKSEVDLRGQQKQIIQFNMGTAKREYFGLRLRSDSADNDVSIDWIKIGRPSIKKVFRYDFNVQNTPVFSKLLFAANGETSIYINGKKLGAHGGQHPYSRMLNIYNNVQGLNKGTNKLCVAIEGYSPHSSLKHPGHQFFFLEGVVIDNHGNRVNLKTDQKWQGGYNDKGCLTEEKELKRVTVRGSVKDHWPVLTAMLPHERFGERPYLGRIKLEYGIDDKPVFLEHKDIEVKFNIIGSSSISKNSHVIKYQLKKWSDDKRQPRKTLRNGVISGTNGVINLKKLKPEVYEFFITYHINGKIVDEIRGELAVVGKIDQEVVKGESYIEGMQLKKIDSIEFSPKMNQNILCSEHNKNKSSYLNKSSTITSRLRGFVDANLSDLGLELSVKRAAWCSVKFKAGSLYKPHLIEIEYPDDGTRSMVFAVSEESRFPNINNIGRGGGIPRLTTGVFTNNQGASSSVVKRFIYWPNKKEAALTIVNTGRNYLDRGAIKSLAVYEIENNLPAFSIPSKDKSDLFVGPFVERVDRTTPRLFYSGSLEAKFSHELMGWGNFPGYYNAWYSTISNLIKYMRFSGQNTYYAGIYMYSGGWFKSKKFQGRSETGVDYFSAGWSDGAYDLMAKMFEENGLNLVLGVQFIGSRTLSETNDISYADLLDGAESTRFIDKNGHQLYGFQNQGYNFLSAKVSKEISALANEIGEKFSKYKAVKGITWMRQPEFPLAPITTLGRTPLDIGYGDSIISMYKKQVATLLPTAPNPKKRFNYRYQWLMKHEKEQWVQWRCQKIFESDRKISDIFSKYRSDWKMWRLAHRPVPELIKKWIDREINTIDVYRYMGTDPRLYTKSNQLSLMLIDSIGSKKQYELRKQLKSISDETSKFYAEIEKNNGLMGVSTFAHLGFILETRLRTKKEWPWKHLDVVGYSMPSEGIFYSRADRHVLNHEKDALAIGWSDVGNFSGYEQDVRNYWLGK